MIRNSIYTFGEINMDNKLICPQCGHDKFRCEATINATLIISSDSTGETNYKLYEWDDVESIQYFSCQKCDFEFAGDEDEFREYLKTNHTDANE